MSSAVIFVMTGSGIITWLLYNYILIPFRIEYLRTMSFILVIAAFVLGGLALFHWFEKKGL